MPSLDTLIAHRSGASSFSSDIVDTQGLSKLVLQMRVVISAVNLIATLTPKGINAPGPTADPGAPSIALTDGALVSVVPTEITITNAGVITIATGLAAGTYDALVSYDAKKLPRQVAWDWAYTSGGGTVSLSLTAHGW